ncbi:hypothetical protein N8384_06620 [Candidatus Thioglobus sp.]|nr:hypothetical protein [Candidatus Thioglobus sp.]
MLKEITFQEHGILNGEITDQVNIFLRENNYQINTLFTSPAWINKTLNSYDIDYKFVMFFKDYDLIAVHLRFNEYRGFIRISNYNFMTRILILPILKKLFSYTIWKNPIIFKQDLSQAERNYINHNFELIINKINHVKSSPIDSSRKNQFNNNFVSDWATYIFDFEGKSYSDIRSLYSRNLNRSLNSIKNNPNIHCKRLNFSVQNDVEKYVNWVKIAQKNTGKRFKYNVDTLIQENKYFNLQGFTYEVFIATNNTEILGSLAIYGDAHYVNEFEANASLKAKKSKFMIHDLIRDSVVEFCLKKGILIYDLSGFNPSEDRSKKEEGIKFGKSKFHAEEFKYKILNW